MRRFRNFREDRFNLRHRGLEIGTELETEKKLFLSLDLLPKGTHVLGPPGVGKTKLLTHAVDLFCRLQRTCLIVLNSKGGFGRASRDAAINAGQTDRLVIFDPNDQEFVCGYNPLKPNSLPMGVHARSVREAIRSSWGQASFDSTPQLARYLFLALYVAREREMTIIEAAQILRPGSPLRHYVLNSVADPYIKEALLHLDSLRPERQEDLLASSLARLEAFSLDSMLRSMLMQRERTLNIADVINQNKILIVDVPFYDPLRPTEATLLIRLILHDILACVFGREDKTNRIIIVADEVHTYADEDLCVATELGRELNLCTVMAHQHMAQLLGDDGSTRLLDAIKECCKTRLVFGGNWKKNLEELTEDMFIDQYNPWAIKDEIRSLELEPIESTRVSRSAGDATTHGTSRSYGETETESHGRGVQRSRSASIGGSETTGTSESDTEGENEGQSETNTAGGSVERGRSHSEEIGESETDSHVHTRGQAVGVSHGTNRSRTISHGTTLGHSTSVTDGDGSGASYLSASGSSIDPEGNINSSNSLALGSNSNNFSAQSETDSFSESEIESQSEGESDSVTFTQGQSTAKGRALGKSRSRGNAESQSAGINWSKSGGRSTGRTWAKTYSRDHSLGSNWSESDAEGESESQEEGSAKNWTDGENDSMTKNRSSTESPFYEYIKRRPVVNRTYLTEQEQMTEFLKKIKAQPVGHFVLKVQGKKARFMKAPFVADRVVPKNRLAQAREKIFALPYYTRKADIKREEFLKLPAPVLVESDPAATMNGTKKYGGRNPTLDIKAGRALKVRSKEGA
jgi:hypothetical protein